MAEKEAGTFSPQRFMDLITDKGYTPATFAEALGAAPATVAKWLAGINVPRESMLLASARLLGVNRQDLLE